VWEHFLVVLVTPGADKDQRFLAPLVDVLACVTLFCDVKGVSSTRGQQCLMHSGYAFSGRDQIIRTWK
jgi:hypothetical protein